MPTAPLPRLLDSHQHSAQSRRRPRSIDLQRHCTRCLFCSSLLASLDATAAASSGASTQSAAQLSRTFFATAAAFLARLLVRLGKFGHRSSMKRCPTLRVLVMTSSDLFSAMPQLLGLPNDRAAFACEMIARRHAALHPLTGPPLLSGGLDERMPQSSVRRFILLPAAYPKARRPSRSTKLPRLTNTE